MSLRVVPKETHTCSTKEATGAPSAPGIHDTFRTNLGLTRDAVPSSCKTAKGTKVNESDAILKSKHPLEARLANWRATQDNLKMEMLRRTFGIAEPVRRGMELRIVGAGEWKPCVLGGSANLHSDILAGRDMDISWEDVFCNDELQNLPDIHTEIEARLNIV